MKKYISVFILLLLLVQSVYANTLSPQLAQRYNEYYNNGIILYKAGNYTSAISEFRKVLRVLPYDATVRKALVSSYLARAEFEANKSGEYKKAIIDIKSALFYLKYWGDGALAQDANIIASAEENLVKLEKSGFEDSIIYQNALLERQQGEFAASGYDLNRLSKGQFKERAYETLGDIYKSLNNQQKAIECYRKIIQTDNKNAHVYFKYALIMDEAGNAEAAAEYYNLALKYGENNLQLLENLESLWLSRIAEDPNDAQSYINLGTVLHKKKDYAGAKAQYLRARTLDPSDMVALYNLASLYNDMKFPTDAISVYNEILYKEPNNTVILAYRATSEKQLKNYQAAISSYKTIIQIKPNSKEAQIAKAEIDDIVLKNYTGSDLINYLTLEANSNPSDFAPQYNLAYEYHKQNKFDSAIPYYQRAMSLKPNYEDAYINLAQIYLNKDDIANAKNTISKGLLNLPSSTKLKDMKNDITNKESGDIYDLATKYWSQKKFDTALKEYLKIPNQTPEVVEAIAGCYWELKNYSKAIEYYQKLLSKNPNDINTLQNLASCYFEAENYPQSKAYYNKILSLNPENQDAKTAIKTIDEGEEAKALDAAFKLYENKDYYGAQLALGKILSKNPNNLYANYYRGVIYEEQKKLEEAIIYYKKATSIDPDFSLAYYGLGIIADGKEKYQDAVQYYDKYLALRAKDDLKTDDYLIFVKKRNTELKNYLKSLNKTN